MSQENQVEAQQRKIPLQGGRALLTMALIVVVVTGLKLAASFLIPVAFAFFLSILSMPIMHGLMKYRVPHVAALLLTVLSIVSCIGLLVWGGIGLLKTFQKEVPGYVVKLKHEVDDAAVWLEERGVDGVKATIDQFLDVQGIINFATQQDVMKTLASMAGSTFGTVATVLASMVIVIVLMLFILIEAPSTQSKASLVRKAGGPDLTLFMQATTDIQKYLGVKTLISLGTGILAAVLCMIFGLKYYLLWGLLAFLFNFIPAIGSTSAGIPAMIEALVNHGFGAAVLVGIGYALINFGLDNLLQPMLMGRRFGISGLVIILSIIFWGWLWGPIGMFLAIPLTMMIKVFLDNTKEFRWISVAMAKSRLRGGEVIIEADPSSFLEEAPKPQKEELKSK